MFFELCGWIAPEELQMPPQTKWKDSFSLQCNKPDTHAIAAAYPMPDSMPLEPMTFKFCQIILVRGGWVYYRDFQFETERGPEITKLRINIEVGPQQT
jgi:hypothetical protein